MEHALLASEQSVDSALFPIGTPLSDLTDRFEREMRQVSAPLGFGLNWSMQGLETQQTWSNKGRFSTAPFSSSVQTVQRSAVDKARHALDEIRSILEARETRKRLADEFAWIEGHRREYAGQWIALLGSKLLASGESAREVFQAVANTNPIPLVLRIDNEESPFAGW